MVLKRKRSESEVPGNIQASSPSSCASTSTTTSPTNPLYSRARTPSYLSSRTRKRHRDNRPSEDSVHQNTLSLLFNAQKHAVPSPPLLSSRLVAAASPRQCQSQSAQPSLHSFWAISARPYDDRGDVSISPLTRLDFSMPEGLDCEDCGTSFENVDADVMDGDMMDVDVVVNGLDYGCSVCGKQVCHQCSISNLGTQRRCLMCAGKRKWVGRLGWLDQA